MTMSLTPQARQQNRSSYQKPETVVDVANCLVDFEGVWLIFESLGDVLDTTSIEVRDFTERQSRLIRFAEKVVEGRPDANPGATVGYCRKLDREIEAYLTTWINQVSVEERLGATKKFVAENFPSLWAEKEEGVLRAHARFIQELNSEDNDLSKVVPLCAALERELKSVRGVVESRLAAARAQEEADRLHQESETATATARAVLSRLRRDEE